MLFVLKKKYRAVLEQIKDIENILNEKEEVITGLTKEGYDRLEELEKLKKDLIKIKDKLAVSNKQCKEQTKLGADLLYENVTLKNDKKDLEKEIKTLQLKLEESMSDKYLRVKIPSGKTPNTQTSKIKSCVKQSNAIKKVME